MKVSAIFKSITILSISMAGIAHAATVLPISEMTLLDSGGTATINSNANHSQDSVTGVITKTGNGGKISHVSGELNLQSFTIAGTNYNANQFVSGVSPDTVIGTDKLAYVLQPADFLDLPPGRTINNNSGFFAGSTDANGDLVNGADYLVSGERGLSYSTVLNYRPGDDNHQTLSFPLSFKTDPLGAGVTASPTFFAGDGANKQNTDIWRFLNAYGETIAQVTIAGTDDGTVWSKFGGHTVDRLSTDWNGNANDFNNNKTLDIALLAFSLDSNDFLIGSTDKSSRWAEITQLDLVLPGDAGNDPMTDYAFIAMALN